jgi:hypothetical protein
MRSEDRSLERAAVPFRPVWFLLVSQAGRVDPASFLPPRLLVRLRLPNATLVTGSGKLFVCEHEAYLTIVIMRAGWHVRAIAGSINPPR